MPIIRRNPLPEVESQATGGIQGLPQPGGRGGAPLSAFSAPQPGLVRNVDTSGQDLQRAGAYLENASDKLATIALSEMRDANETRVQDLNNQFITKQQELLYTGNDAYYKKRGADAITGAPTATEALQSLQKDLIGQTVNEYQKQRLTNITNAHVSEATNGMSRYVAAQSLEYQKSVAAGKQQLITNEIRFNSDDFDKVEGLAAAAADNARAEAKSAGLTGTEYEQALIQKYRSQAYGTAIDDMVNKGQNRRALAFYEANKGKITDSATADKLDTQMKSIRTDVAADDWVLKNSPNSLPPQVNQWQPKVYEAAQKYGVDPALAMAVLTQESKGNVTAVSSAGAGGLMQLMPDTARGLGVTNVNDPDQNIDGGVRYLAMQMAKYRDQRLALMAYNWGPGNVDAWLKAGANPDKIPAETRGYVPAVQGYINAQTGVGFDKVNAETLIQKASTDPGLNTQERASVIAKLSRQSATIEAARSASIKALDDQYEATTMIAMLSPQNYTKGTMAQIAEGYKQAGDKSKYVGALALASQEELLLTFSESPDEAQKKLLASQLTGKAKALADALISGDAKGRSDAGKIARDELGGLKTAAQAGLPIADLQKKAENAVGLAVKANDSQLAKEIADFFESHVRGQAAGQLPPAAQQKAIDDMRAKISAGQQDNATIESANVMQQIRDQQVAAFAKDAMTAGSQTYRDVGPLAPVTDMASRVQQADKIAANRGLKDISPYTVPEINQIKQTIDTSDPQTQAKTFAGIASSVPARMIPQVAAQIAGKGEGDPLSRSYAAALSFYADKDPAQRQVADQILAGAQIIKNMGDAGKKAPTGDQAWQDTLQTRMGNTFKDTGGNGKVPAIIADAIASVYTYQMQRLGRQGEKIDTDVLDAAAKAVVGETITRKGQMIMPPAKGVGAYGVDQALSVIDDGDLEGLRTQGGDQITADVIYRRGILSNAGGPDGGEGRYFVRIPDPRVGFDPRPIVKPNGDPWVLDLRPLLERARLRTGGGGIIANQPDYIQAPSLAPKRPE